MLPKRRISLDMAEIYRRVEFGLSEEMRSQTFPHGD